MAVGALAGPGGEGLWSRQASALDFYDARGVVQSLLEHLGVSAGFERAEDSLLHPGRTARVLANGQPVGVVGELHPQALERFDLTTPVVACFELDLGLLLTNLPPERHHFHPFSRFPIANRDLAVLVAEELPAERVQGILEDHPLVTRALLFDLYTGSPLPSGMKSLAYRLELQSSAGTLSTEQVNDAVATVMERLGRETGAVLRE